MRQMFVSDKPKLVSNFLIQSDFADKELKLIYIWYSEWVNMYYGASGTIMYG